MMKMEWKVAILAIVILVLPAAFLAACGQVGELQTVTKEVPLNGAEQATVELAMGAGRLDVTGGAQALMEGEFTFNVEEWEPTLDAVEAGDSVELVVAQPELETLGTPDDAENRWEVQLNDAVPLALEVRLGAGRADLDLAELDLRELELNTGASGVNLDLAGDWTEDLDAEIRGGVGELTVRLPAGVGVRVNVEQGLGDVNAGELTEQDGFLVNDAYGETDATLNLDIESGVGTITFEVVE